MKITFLGTTTLLFDDGTDQILSLADMSLLALCRLETKVQI